MKLIKLILLTSGIFLYLSTIVFSQPKAKRSAWYPIESIKEIYTEELTVIENDLVLKINIKDQVEITRPVFSYEDTGRTSMNSYGGYLINNSELNYQIPTQDGSLIMIMEAKDSIGLWRPIEYWFWSDCGNSFGLRELKKWNGITFRVRQYEGEIETAMRLKLATTRQTCMYSEEFQGNITKEQLYEVIVFESEYMTKNDIYLDKYKRMDE